jgi:hypothetical protein
VSARHDIAPDPPATTCDASEGCGACDAEIVAWHSERSEAAGDEPSAWVERALESAGYVRIDVFEREATQ